MTTTGKLETFTFQVGEIKFSKDGFNIVRTVRGDSVSGKFAARVGHCYKAEGKWETHPTYGPQYKLDSAVSIRINTPEALGKFLTLSFKGKGIGEAFFGALVDAVKSDNLDLEEMLDKAQREVLVECVGSRNAKKVEILLAEWPKIKPAADLMSPLLGYGLSEAMAESVLALYGKKALEKVETDPYDLILTIDGISFMKADAIAKKVGRIDMKSPMRLRAAIATGMRDATNNGDIGVRRKTLLTKTMPWVNESIMENGRRKLAPGVPEVVSAALLAQTLDDMIAGKALDEEGNPCGFASDLLEFPDEKGETVVWYAPLIEAEKTIVDRISKFRAPPMEALIAKIDEVCDKLGVVPEPEQRMAVEMALRHPVSVITGGPGCGKSFILKVILTLLDMGRQTGFLCAPTANAAKRITASTGRAASTQHALTGFNGGGQAMFNEQSPLCAQYICIDEASMDDTELLAITLAAAPDDCRIILMGDVDQLASVGPGQTLRDLIRSGVIAVTRLVKSRRFSGGIAEAARAVNRGEVPATSDDGKFVFVETDTPLQNLMAEAKALLDSGVNPDDIQVLAPTHRGDAGCVSLNKAMQLLLNPEPNGGVAHRLKRDNGDIRVGDRILQTKNDKVNKLINGDMGWLENLSSDLDATLTLRDRADSVLLTRKDAQHLILAYCTTIHKSQGAEHKYVLIALDAAGAFMLRRSLPYTAITRGVDGVRLFSSRSTLASAVHRGEPPEGSRRTSLAMKLRAALPPFKETNPSAALAPPPEDSLAKAMLVPDLVDIEF